MNHRAFICGLSGPMLLPGEALFLAGEKPGIILFNRNVQNPLQVKRLIQAAREAAGVDMLVLVDQEGGACSGSIRRTGASIRRPRFAPAAAKDRAAAKSLARLGARPWRMIFARSVSTSTAAGARRARDGADAIISDRAYGRDPARAATLGRAAAEGLMAGGVAPVMKHIPGHGRARADSHWSCPWSRPACGAGGRRFPPSTANADCRWR